MMATPDAKRPTSRFMSELERTLLEELKAISADEIVMSVRQDQGMVNAVNVDRVNQGTPTREQNHPRGIQMINPLRAMMKGHLVKVIQMEKLAKAKQEEKLPKASQEKWSKR